MAEYGQAGSMAKVNAAPATMADHLGYVRKELQETVSRLGGIADRVSGGVPHAVSTSDKPSAVPSLHSAASDIKSLLSDLRDEVNRLDSAI